MRGPPRLLPHPAVCAPAAVCARPGVCAHPAMRTVGPWLLLVSGGRDRAGRRCGC